MDLVVLGASGTYPAAHRPASGYVVRAAGVTILCDVGSGTFVRLVAEMDPVDLDAVVLSHLHPDHSSDLFALLYHLRYGWRRRPTPLDVYAPPGAAARFACFLDAGPDHALHEVLRFIAVEPPTTASVSGVSLDFAAARHSQPALLTRVRAEGRTLVYTGDTGPSPRLVEFAAGADVLLCDASLSDDEATSEDHLTASQAGRLAAEAGVGRLILTHLRPTLVPARAVASAAVAFGREPVLASPGLHVVV